jgi:hypothetical protein
MRLKAALVVLAALVPWSQHRIDARLAALPDPEGVLYVWSGEYLRRLCPGFEDLMADVYWLRTVQYYGGQKAFLAGSKQTYELLEPLTEITVALDPRFEMAYHYAAIFLAEPWPTGAGKPVRAVRLLERGARATGSWRLRQHAGFFTFLFLHDPSRAAQILMEASEMPGAAYWLKTLAAAILQDSGDREVARGIWKTMYEVAEPGAIRSNAEFNLNRLDALDGAQRLQAEVSEYVTRTGQRPSSLRAVPSIAAKKLPIVDARGVPFEYDVSSGAVTISTRSPFWRP